MKRKVCHSIPTPEGDGLIYIDGEVMQRWRNLHLIAKIWNTMGFMKMLEEKIIEIKTDSMLMGREQGLWFYGN